MERSSLSPALTVTTAFFVLFQLSAAQTNTDYIKTSCLATQYPRLCYDSLSVYANQIQTSPRRLAATAIAVAISSAKSTRKSMEVLAKTHGLKPREMAALTDCVEVAKDSVCELNKSMGEMAHAGGPDFQFHISNIQTWVSAALTDEDTCLDGFEGKAMNGNLKITVRRHINKVAHFISNGLALVNKFASAHTPPST